MAAIVLYHYCCACHRNANVLDEQTSSKEKWNNIAYAMIGNLFDRIVHGSVVDYLDFIGGLITGQHLTTDSTICVGAVMIILDGFQKER